MECKIQISGTKPIWFGNRKVLPGETAVVDESQIDRKNIHIKVIDVKKRNNKKGDKKTHGIMESKRSDC